MKQKLIRITTVPISLQKLLTGQMGFMSKNGFEVSMVSSDFEGKQDLEKKEHSSFIPVNMTRTISPLADLKSLYQLVVLFKKMKPTIVHTHTPKAGLIGMLASRLTGVAIRLHTVAGLPLMESRGLKRALLEVVEKITYSCSTKVYPNSNNLKDFILKSNFCKPDKIKVIGAGSSNGIDTNLYRLTDVIKNKGEILRKEHKLNPSNFVFIFIGRLVKDKGIEEFVEAFNGLSKKYPETRLLLVGPEEPELDPLSAFCLKEIQENSSIIATGYQGDVKPYLAISSVLVFPSYREGFPNVPMQAGCFNLPSIVTNINGCNEIIIEGENGLIIPVKDTLAVYNAMERLILDQNLSQKLASNSRRMIIDRYEQNIVWSLILQEYQKHLNNKGFV